MGLPSWINWINWLFFTLILFIPVSIIVTYFLVGNFGLAPIADANPFIIWIILILFMVAFITLIFALSTFFTNGQSQCSCHQQSKLRVFFIINTLNCSFIYFFNLLNLFKRVLKNINIHYIVMYFTVSNPFITNFLIINVLIFS